MGSFRPQDKLESQTFQDLHCVATEAAPAVFVEGNWVYRSGSGPHFMLDFSGFYLIIFKWKIGATIESHS